MILNISCDNYRYDDSNTTPSLIFSAINSITSLEVCASYFRLETWTTGFTVRLNKNRHAISEGYLRLNNIIATPSPFHPLLLLLLHFFLSAVSLNQLQTTLTDLTSKHSFSGLNRLAAGLAGHKTHNWGVTGTGGLPGRPAQQYDDTSTTLRRDHKMSQEYTRSANLPFNINFN